MQCGPCADQGLEIAPGGTYDYTWTAATVKLESRGSWECARSTNLPAGQYQILVPVYASADDAVAKTSPRVVAVTFSVPLAGDRLTLELAAP